MNATERAKVMRRHGANLATWLDGRGLTLIAAARMMDVSRSTLGRMVKGSSPIYVSDLGRLSEAAGVDFYDLGMAVTARAAGASQ